MESGEREVSVLLHHLSRIGLTVRKRNALDFGCGVGRLTQALAARFEHVLGIDISPRMIDLARKISRFSNAQYRVNDDPSLIWLESSTFEFIYSSIVLQHIEPDLSKAYLGSFVRILRPNGLLVFQLPSHLAENRSNGPAPMKDSAYRAQISFADVVPQLSQPGERLGLSLRIQNDSDVTWSQQEVGAIRLGNHWLSPAGEMLIQDDGRAAIPSTLIPGDDSNVQLFVTAPEDPGEYILEVDVVHEGITWFRDRGSQPASVAVSVVGERNVTETSPTKRVYRNCELREAASITQTPPAPFPMYGIRKEEVTEELCRIGAKVLRVEDDDHGRPEWVGYRYFVSKPSDRGWSRWFR